MWAPDQETPRGRNGGAGVTARRWGSRKVEVRFWAVTERWERPWHASHPVQQEDKAVTDAPTPMPQGPGLQASPAPVSHPFCFSSPAAREPSVTTAPLDTSTALSPLSRGSASTSSDRSLCPPGALASPSPGGPGPLAWASGLGWGLDLFVSPESRLPGPGSALGPAECPGGPAPAPGDTDRVSG